MPVKVPFNISAAGKGSRITSIDSAKVHHSVFGDQPPPPTAPPKRTEFPAAITGLLAKYDIHPVPGGRFDLKSLDAHLANQNLSIDERLSLKSALRQIGVLA